VHAREHPLSGATLQKPPIRRRGLGVRQGSMASAANNNTR
jgi:hypothetical protein